LADEAYKNVVEMHRNLNKQRILREKINQQPNYEQLNYTESKEIVLGSENNCHN
jgi:hypothetical protein